MCAQVFGLINRGGKEKEREEGRVGGGSNRGGKGEERKGGEEEEDKLLGED